MAAVLILLPNGPRNWPSDLKNSDICKGEINAKNLIQWSLWGKSEMLNYIDFEYRGER